MTTNKTIEEIRADYHLFIDIQMGKYLKQVKRESFQSKDEAQKVLGKIIDAYNNKVAAQHERLDNSSLEAKVAWFNFIEINFDDAAAGSSFLFDDEEEISGSSDDSMEHFDNLFPFLPKRSVIFLTYASPAFEAFGYPLEKLNKLMDGQRPTVKEKELLVWAYDIAFGVMGFHIEKDTAIKEMILKKTVKIARKKLKANTAQKVVEKILADIEDNDK